MSSRMTVKPHLPGLQAEKKATDRIAEGVCVVGDILQA